MCQVLFIGPIQDDIEALFEVTSDHLTQSVQVEVVLCGSSSSSSSNSGEEFNLFICELHTEVLHAGSHYYKIIDPAREVDVATPSHVCVRVWGSIRNDSHPSCQSHVLRFLTQYVTRHACKERILTNVPAVYVAKEFVAILSTEPLDPRLIPRGVLVARRRKEQVTVTHWRGGSLLDTVRAVWRSTALRDSVTALQPQNEKAV
jgi:hypothetical protein